MLCTIIKRQCIFEFTYVIFLTFGKISCKNASLITTSFGIGGSFIYLPFLSKTCSSGIELTIKSDGKSLCTSQIFTFQSLPVGLETSSCVGPISLIILKFGMYFASQFDFLSEFLIMTKSSILYCGTSSYFSLSYLEWASLVFRDASI